MPIHSKPTNVNDAFFQPLTGLAAASPHARYCREFSDEHWLLTGVRRCLEPVESGRAFLQEHGPDLPCLPSHANYFNSLHSERRLELVREVNRAVLASARWPDRLEAMPELRKYECFALDGHWHKAATHDPRHKETKMAVGHFYSLDLRGHQLRALATGEGLHEHDMSALKRIKPTGLRQDAPKGKRVLIVYDKAGIDFAFWKRCRVEKAVYFLSRAKEGMVYDWIEDRPVDPNDSRNQGLQSDRLIALREGGLMRLIRYIEPDQGKTYEFLASRKTPPCPALSPSTLPCEILLCTPMQPQIASTLRARPSLPPKPRPHARSGQCYLSSLVRRILWPLTVIRLGINLVADQFANSERPNQ